MKGFWRVVQMLPEPIALRDSCANDLFRDFRRVLEKTAGV
jgi:hypothetical protein